MISASRNSRLLRILEDVTGTGERRAVCENRQCGVQDWSVSESRANLILLSESTRFVRSTWRGEYAVCNVRLCGRELAPTAATARQPSHGSPSRSSRFGVSPRERRLVDQNSASWNQVAVLLSRIDALRLGA
jgi:hypothetical protein